MRYAAILAITLSFVSHTTWAQNRIVRIDSKVYSDIFKAIGILFVDVDESAKYASGVSEHGEVFVLDLNTSKVTKLDLPGIVASALCFSADGQHLFIGEVDGHMLVYNINNRKIIQSIKVFNFIHSVNRLGSKHIAVTDNCKTKIISITSTLQIQSDIVSFADIESVYRCADNTIAIVHKSENIMLIDGNMSIKSPRFKFAHDPNERVRCAGFRSDGKPCTVYCTDAYAYSEVEGVEGRLKSAQRLKSAPIMIYRLDTFWIICGQRDITILDDTLRVVGESSLAKNSVFGPASIASFAKSGNAAVIIFGHDWDLSAYTIRFK